MPIINGRSVDKDFMSGDEIINEARPEPGRRVVIRKGTDAYTIRKDWQYGPKQLRDKKDRPVRIETIPDRTKGAQSRLHLC